MRWEHDRYQHILIIRRYDAVERELFMWLKTVCSLDGKVYKSVIEKINEPVTPDSVYDAIITVRNDLAELKKAQVTCLIFGLFGAAFIGWYVLVGSNSSYGSQLKPVAFAAAFALYSGFSGLYRAHEASSALESLMIRGQDALLDGGEMRAAFDRRADAEQAVHAHQTTMFELSARQSAAENMANAAASSAEAAAASATLAREASQQSSSVDLSSAQFELRSAAHDLAYREKNDQAGIASARGRLAVAESRARAAGG